MVRAPIQIRANMRRFLGTTHGGFNGLGPAEGLPTIGTVVDSQALSELVDVLSHRWGS